ncbi:hypothetical protein B5V89_06435 [Heyndrickxia sporothermodurans]|uniref:hypothetical protein n=1 Tax=Heyndrickxia sporothermodurans TaxID=46224 RepID=UPI000D38B7E2|nr:hypothetical protein [Heyndrickxia sporothermodurans]PTY79255.1 hypothetical protein B5V89_06435 [Heyndrickxia sporothermodurans]
MEIILESPNGKVYKANKQDQSTFTVLIDGEEYKISLLESDQEVNIDGLTKKQKKQIAKAIVESGEILDQLEQSELDSEEDDILNYEDYKRYKNEVIK